MNFALCFNAGLMKKLILVWKFMLKIQILLLKSYLSIFQKNLVTYVNTLYILFYFLLNPLSKRF